MANARVPSVDQLPEGDEWLLSGQVVLLGRDHRDTYQAHLRSALPAAADHMVLAGYDWLGRPFGPPADGGAAVLLYDVAFDELMEFPSPGGRLRDSPLFHASDDNFGAAEYAAFVGRLGVARLGLGECAGFTVPPQLGGEVSACNLEVYQVPTYWHLLALIQDALDQLPEGAMLRDIRIE